MLTFLAIWTGALTIGCAGACIYSQDAQVRRTERAIRRARSRFRHSALECAGAKQISWF